jgi:hypothetical protein
MNVLLISLIVLILVVIGIVAFFIYKSMTKPPPPTTPPTTTKPIPIPTGKVIFAVKSNGNYIGSNGQTPNQADAIIFQLASDGTIYLNNKKWLYTYATYNNDGMFIMTQDGKLYGYRMDDQDSPIVEISTVQDALKNNNNEFALTVKYV